MSEFPHWHSTKKSLTRFLGLKEFLFTQAFNQNHRENPKIQQILIQTRDIRKILFLFTQISFQGVVNLVKKTQKAQRAQKS
jgi:hypothetical protein